MKKTLKKSRRHIKNKSKHIKKYRKTNRTKDKHNKHHKYHKHHKSNKSNKYMKGGAALYYNNPSAAGKVSNVSYNIHGPTASAKNTYIKHTDRPVGPLSYINFTPPPLLNTLWSAESGIKNFFNELLGISKQSTPDPTQQPLGKTINPYIPKEITSNQINNVKNQILNKFNS